MRRPRATRATGIGSAAARPDVSAVSQIRVEFDFPDIMGRPHTSKFVYTPTGVDDPLLVATLIAWRKVTLANIQASTDRGEPPDAFM